MIIDSEFESLIPPLTEDEYRGLEASIIAEGCRDALLCWNNILIDGHNRYKICNAKGIRYHIKTMQFADRNEVKLWIMRNQLSRRNLNDFQRIEITHKCEDAVRTKARERQGTRHDIITFGQKFPKVDKVSRATDELGSMAGVSRKTYEHAVTVLKEAPAPVVKAARNNEISVNAAYEVTKLPKEQQAEISERIEHGETPKEVVSDVRSRAGVSTKTYEKAVKIIEEAPDEIKEAVRSGDMSIDRAYNHVKRVEKEREIEQAKADIASQESPDYEAVLYIGDGIKHEPKEPYDLLLTDPPYSTDVDDIDEFVASWLYHALDNVKPIGFAYVFIGAYPEELRAYLNAETPSHIELSQVLIWTYKNTLGNNPKDRYKQNYQACLFYRGVEAPSLDCPLTNEQWAIQEINAPDGRLGDRYHAWQKPMEIAERFIRHSTKHGDVVFDPFACTGTFLLAASKLGRKSYGFEIDPKNAAIAQERGVRLIE